MSLCRWSSMNWKCDLYCYYDVNGGITTHVATRRVVGNPPERPDPATCTKDEWLAASRKLSNFLEEATHLPIGLPEDDKTFNDPDLASFKSRLTYLRDLGYVFPDELFDIDEEP